MRGTWLVNRDIAWSSRACCWTYKTNKQKQYQEALDNTFNPAGYRVSNMTPTNIERRIITAVNIAIGDDGHRAKEILENWQQLMEMDDKTYLKQVKFYG